MARDPLLRDAVRAIKAKIESAAEIATPEELAYLGTAIDRIGGRATVLEVEEMGDIKMAELTQHAQQVQTSTLSTISAAAAAAIDHVMANKAQAEASMDQTKAATLATMAQVQSNTTQAIHDAAQAAIQQAAIARDQAVATAQAAANSITQQLVLGRKTFFLAQL